MKKLHSDLPAGIPEEQGMASEPLSRLRELLADRKCDIRSFTVARGRHVVFEQHRHDIPPHSQQDINSMTKSVVAVLIGAALHQGVISRLDAQIADYLPEAREAGVSPLVATITLRDLLTMTSGFAWNERKMDPRLLGVSDEFKSGDRLRYALSRDIAYPPGTHFEYDSYAAHLLSVILSRASGNDLKSYAQQALFDPLDIVPPPWATDEDGIPFGGRGLKLTMQDLLKIGLLMLAGGEWEGRRILSADYVAASTQSQCTASLPTDGSEKGFGYMWWIDTSRSVNPPYFASGYGEQLLQVEPELELVAAVTANHTRAPKHVREFWKDYVCAAVTGPIRR